MQPADHPTDIDEMVATIAMMLRISHGGVPCALRRWVAGRDFSTLPGVDRGMINTYSVLMEEDGLIYHISWKK